MDSSYSRVVVSDVADSSVVVEVGVDVRLSLSLTLSVQIVQTSVHVRVDSMSVVHTSNIVDRNGVVDSVDRMSIIDSSYMADGTVSNSSIARDDTITMVNSSHDSTVCQTSGDLSYGVGFSFSISIDRHSGQKYNDEGSHGAACSGGSWVRTGPHVLCLNTTA